MKSSHLAIAAVLATFALTGCASIYPVGTVYTDVKIPVQATDNGTSCAKVGTAQANTILGLVATGDASVQAAAENGGITKIHTVDWDVENVLGLFGTYTTTVCGE